jgi:hypothetical protein
MAFLVDTHNISGTSRSTKKAFRKFVYPRLIENFPDLFRLVSEYYRSRNRSITEEHFIEIAYARMVNMYNANLTVKRKEHPLNSGNKCLRLAYLGLKKDL